MESPVSSPVVPHKRYDLEDRTAQFSADIRAFIRSLPKGSYIQADADQLIRASGSVGANYIEANEALGKRDFTMRIRICLKEAKESRYWLRMFPVCSDILMEQERHRLMQEAHELLRIFFAILQKIQANNKKSP